MSDFDGLRPAGPPPELRGRVLAAAREAVGSRSPGLFELLVADRAVRISVAVVCLLFFAHFLVDRDLRGEAPFRPVVSDEASAAAETGLTAAEQINELEPAL